MVNYVCENPDCDSYTETVERPKECSNPVCNDYGEELTQEG